MSFFLVIANSSMSLQGSNELTSYMAQGREGAEDRSKKHEYQEGEPKIKR